MTLLCNSFLPKRRCTTPYRIEDFGEGGALLSYGMLSFSVGVSSVSFSTIGVHAGIGIRIPVR